MDKLKMHSLDGVERNIELIGKLFPNAITEVMRNGKVEHAIDFDALRQELSDSIVEGREERYQFTWPDKKKAMLAANAPITATLRPVVADSVGKDGTPGGFDSENLYIEGDNLEVLKLLQETYLGKVKMIYIDPPYNTGNDFVYEDDFAQSAAEYMDNSGQYDEEGNRLVTNTESNGRFHTDWLNMIYPRLKIAKNLLADDGVIFISIDENEVNTLKMICDEIFGGSNFVAELIWSAGRKNDSKYISVSHEYILCYFRNAQYIKDNKIIWREKKQGLSDIYAEYDKLKNQFGSNYEAIEGELKKWYKALPDGHPAKDHAHYNKVDERGVFFAADISWPGGGGPKYEVLHPVTKRPVKIPSRGWITNQATLNQWISKGKVNFGKDESAVPTVKSYLAEHEYGVPYSVFYQDGRAASKRLATLMGEKVFENPKDEDVIQRLIQFCGVNEGDIVLDFFAGSATTAHALFLANIEQNIKRKFILVQVPEVIDPQKAGSEKSKKVAQNAVKLLDSINAPHNICEIGKERIRRAGEKIKEENPLTTQNLDIGFRVFRVDESNMKNVYYHPEEVTQLMLGETVSNIKEDRTDLDLLYACLLDWGVEINLSHTSTQVAGCTVHNVDNGALAACFDKAVPRAVVEYIANLQPLRAVFRDSAFATDAEKINVTEIFKNLSPDTKVKVI